MENIYDKILNLKGPSDKFYCLHSSNNEHLIQFIGVRMRDVDNNKVYFDITRPIYDNSDLIISEDLSEEEVKEMDQQRTIYYEFNKELLYSKTVGCQIEFKVGDKPVKDFKIIDRLFYKDKLLKEYKFEFPFCPPDAVNTWEVIYNLPEITDEIRNDILENPFIMTTDSYYFVGDNLVIQNKAYYKYV